MVFFFFLHELIICMSEVIRYSGEQLSYKSLAQLCMIHWTPLVQTIRDGQPNLELMQEKNGSHNGIPQIAATCFASRDLNSPMLVYSTQGTWW